jgi:hypothetical protein
LALFAVRRDECINHSTKKPDNDKVHSRGHDQPHSRNSQYSTLKRAVTMQDSSSQNQIVDT